MTEVTSNDLIESFRLPLFHVFLALLAFRVEWVRVILTPHQGEGGSEAHPGDG